MGVCFSLDHIQKQEENLLKTAYGNNAIKKTILFIAIFIRPLKMKNLQVVPAECLYPVK